MCKLTGDGHFGDHFGHRSSDNTNSEFDKSNPNVKIGRIQVIDI